VWIWRTIGSREDYWEQRGLLAAERTIENIFVLFLIPLSQFMLCWTVIGGVASNCNMNCIYNWTYSNSTWCEKRWHLFLSFPYVCPEPVLAKCSYLYINGCKRGKKRNRQFVCFGGRFLRDIYMNDHLSRQALDAHFHTWEQLRKRLLLFACCRNPSGLEKLGKDINANWMFYLHMYCGTKRLRGFVQFLIQF
jgi:hypothetical protein